MPDKFLAELERLKGAATKGPIQAVDMRPEADRIIITDGVVVVARIENTVMRDRKLTAEDAANAKLITLLFNHADALAELVRALEPFATEYQIAEESGELQHWPESEVARCKAAYHALAKLNGAEK